MIKIFNDYLKDIFVIIFILLGILMTLKLKFLQITGFKKFCNLLTQPIKKTATRGKTLTAFQALFTAMATTIGVGNIVGPSMAIATGGPGALFWLLFYIMLGSALKYKEVFFALSFKKIDNDGNILGGPFEYLKAVSVKLAKSYALLTVILFTVWSSIQVNTIASIFHYEGMNKTLTGFFTILVLLFIVLGSVKRIGKILEKLVPFMLVFYLTFAVCIIFKNIRLLPTTMELIVYEAFSTKSIVGGGMSCAFLHAMKAGVFKSIFITESGIGTASIAHSLSNVKNPKEQAILAMFSCIIDIFLCFVSGLITLLTGLWKDADCLNNIIIYKIFKMECPVQVLNFLLLSSMFLFSLTSLVGNTFNGGQSFSSLFGNRYIKLYFFVTAFIAFLGAIMETPLLWDFMDVVLTFVVLTNISGILYLTFSKKHFSNQ